MDLQELKSKIEENFSIMEEFLDSLKDMNQEMYNISSAEYAAVRQMYESIIGTIDQKERMFQPTTQEMVQLESMLRDTEIAIENAQKFINAQQIKEEDKEEEDTSTAMVLQDQDIDGTEVILEEIVTPGGFFQENPMAKRVLLSMILGSAIYAGKWMVDAIKKEI